tara:strand:- start:21 stop:512 length:492 start_codon:yes stop_codon:yes gene_type:complete
MEHDSPEGRQNFNQERGAGDTLHAEDLSTLILDSNKEASKLPGVAVTFNNFNNAMDFKYHTEIMKNVEKVLATGKAGGDIRYFKKDPGKGTFNSNLHVAYMNEKSHILFAIIGRENVITFELNVEDAGWIIPVNTSQCTLGDAVRESHVVMAHMAKRMESSGI